MSRYLVLRLAERVLPRVPPPVGYRVAGLAGDLAYLLAARTRRLVRRNLDAIVDPDVDEGRRRAMTRLAFRNLLYGYFELFHLPGADVEELERRGTVDGLEHLDASEATRTGAIVVFAHSGNLEVMSQLAIRRPGRRFTVIIERMPDRRVHALFRRLRQSQGLALVHADRPVALLRRFRTGDDLVVAGDLSVTGTCVVVDFFGRPARMPYGAVKLALRTGAPLLVVAGWRDPGAPARYGVRVDPPLALDGSATSDADVRAGVQRLVARLEEIIAARPEQWLAFREIWDDDLSAGWGSAARSVEVTS